MNAHKESGRRFYRAACCGKDIAAKRRRQIRKGTMLNGLTTGWYRFVVGRECAATQENMNPPLKFDMQLPYTSDGLLHFYYSSPTSGVIR